MSRGFDARDRALCGRLGDLDELDEIFQDRDREMLAFAEKVRASDNYHKFSDATKVLVDLYIKAYGGDEDAVIALSDQS